jgi:hypothetical protein
MSNITTRLGGVTRASIAGDNQHFPGDDPIGDAEALRQAMRDPRYAKSASFRAMVAEAIAESMVTTSSNPNAGTGRFQVLTEEQAVEREAQQVQQVGLTAHDQAMISKAQKHGF